MFKIGSKYSRQDVGLICYPEKGRPAGGNWDTGYVTFEDKLIVFMNIGIAGRTGHNYQNYYDQEAQEITWYGKTKAHSGQNIFKKLISQDLTPHYFARWDTKEDFVYLGVGLIKSFKDDVTCFDSKGNQTHTIELKLKIENSTDILNEIIPSELQKQSKNIKEKSSSTSSFLREKDLEKYMINNWSEISLSQNYNLVPNPKTKRPGQNWAGSGPLDILAEKKDHSELLVIELKKGRPSDEVVGQITRYMGWIKNNLLKEGQELRGLIIAYEDDRNLRLSLNIVKDVSFLKYEYHGLKLVE